MEYLKLFFFLFLSKVAFADCPPGQILIEGVCRNCTDPNAIIFTVPAVASLKSSDNTIDSAYIGGGYIPSLHRTYFSPYGQSLSSHWHYIDEDKNEVVSYDPPSDVVENAYADAVYTPTLNRLYFVPHQQADQDSWHWVDGDKGEVISQYFNTSALVSQAYWGGVYVSKADLIFFFPYHQVYESTWHLINCKKGGNLESYDASGAIGLTQFFPPYLSGGYTPTMNRIYLSPNAQYSEPHWHYIDVKTRTVVMYPAPPFAAGSTGAVFSPLQNRLYFIPAYSWVGPTSILWYYVDCDTDGELVGYSPPLTQYEVFFNGGIYSPAQARIYFLPKGPGDQATVEDNSWIYIDCLSGKLFTYHHDRVTNYDFNYGAFSTASYRIYFANSGPESEWWYLFVGCSCQPGYVGNGELDVTCSGCPAGQLALNDACQNCSDPHAFVASVAPIARSYLTGNINAVANAYYGGGYLPNFNRIYFAPYGQANLSATAGSSNSTFWHFVDCYEGTVGSYHAPSGSTETTDGSGLADMAYADAVYAPTLNRLYFVPHGQAPLSQWHYIAGNNGTVVTYTHGVNATNLAYIGGVYVPTSQRLYFLPYQQSEETFWHYVDGLTGEVVGYPASTGSSYVTYLGGAYSPLADKIFLAPYNQNGVTSFRYVNGKDASIGTYFWLNQQLPSKAYAGAVYDPVNNFIFFVPYNMATMENWHYISATDVGITIGSYTGGTGAVSAAYRGGSYVASQQRVYFTPFGQSNQPIWHYIDCTRLTVIAYAPSLSNSVTATSAMTSAVAMATASASNSYLYSMQVYSPMNYRVYFSPYGGAPQNKWQYLDVGCSCEIGYYGTEDADVKCSTCDWNYMAYNNLEACDLCDDGMTYDVEDQECVSCVAHSALPSDVVMRSNNISVVLEANAYFGAGLYDYKIYFAPFHQGPAQNWHYLDTRDGTFVTYPTTNIPAVDSAYAGAVYYPGAQHQYSLLVFIPYGQAPELSWHYILNDELEMGQHNLATPPVWGAYIGGVMCPNQRRLYFMPYEQSTQPQWHYMTNGLYSSWSIVAYNTSIPADEIVKTAYWDGVYSPLEDRIYLVPYSQSSKPQWHYIDCFTGDVISYTPSSSLSSSSVIPAQAYRGGAYSPTLNRIYFAPSAIAPESQWHYVDANTGAIVAYTHNGTAVSNAYAGAAFVPSQYRIYFTPNAQSMQGKWHYLDCSSGEIISYNRDNASIPTGGYAMQVYVPSNLHLYFSPASQSANLEWHYLDTSCQCDDDYTMEDGTCTTDSLFSVFLIVAIIVGTIMICLLLAYICYYRRQRKREEEREPPINNDYRPLHSAPPDLAVPPRGVPPRGSVVVVSERLTTRTLVPVPQPEAKSSHK